VLQVTGSQTPTTPARSYCDLSDKAGASASRASDYTSSNGDVLPYAGSLNIRGPTGLAIRIQVPQNAWRPPWNHIDALNAFVGGRGIVPREDQVRVYISVPPNRVFSAVSRPEGLLRARAPNTPCQSQTKRHTMNLQSESRKPVMRGPKPKPQPKPSPPRPMPGVSRAVLNDV
jgi:hypothetical protein